MLEEQASKIMTSAAKLCNSLLFNIRLMETSLQTNGQSTRETKDTAFQDLLLQLTYGQNQTPIALIKKLKGNPLLSDLLASLKHSSYTRFNFAEIDFSKFDFGNPESPLRRKLKSVANGLASPGSAGRRTEMSNQTRRDSNSEIDVDDCFSIAE